MVYLSNREWMNGGWSAGWIRRENTLLNLKIHSYTRGQRLPCCGHYNFHAAVRLTVFTQHSGTLWWG